MAEAFRRDVIAIARLGCITGTKVAKGSGIFERTGAISIDRTDVDDSVWSGQRGRRTSTGRGLPCFQASSMCGDDDADVLECAGVDYVDIVSASRPACGR
jgi:hypothetical protein